MPPARRRRSFPCSRSGRASSRRSAARVRAAVAPLGMVLAVWALTLFAGECFGLAAAVPRRRSCFSPTSRSGGSDAFRCPSRSRSRSCGVGSCFSVAARRSRRALMLGLGGVARTETLALRRGGARMVGAWTHGARARRSRPCATGLVRGGVAGGRRTLRLAEPPRRVPPERPGVCDGRGVSRRACLRSGDGRLLCALAPCSRAAAPDRVTAAWWPRGDRADGRTSSLWRCSPGARDRPVSAARAVAPSPLRHRRVAGRPPCRPRASCSRWSGIVIVWSRGGPAARFAVVLVVSGRRDLRAEPARRRLSAVGDAALSSRSCSRGSRSASARRLGLLWTPHARRLRVVRGRPPDRRPGLQVRPTLALRGAELLQRAAWRALRTLRRRAFPTDALVVVDGGFADLQIQVPLWLVFGRETVVVSTGDRAVARALARPSSTTGRPVYWIQNRLARRPESARASCSRPCRRR